MSSFYQQTPRTAFRAEPVAIPLLFHFRFKAINTCSGFCRLGKRNRENVFLALGSNNDKTY